VKNWILGIGLALLPLCYVGLMLATHEPIDWTVLVLIVVIVVPIFIFRTRINKVEKEFNAMSGKEQAQAVAKAAGHVAKQATKSWISK
jgi:ABC-type bacteriocin/lantibiotic exporter with double-glycine peptidase domain